MEPNLTSLNLENGAGIDTAPASLGGFDAGQGWDGHYDFTAAGVNAVGDIPMPSQAKIDNFQRTVAKLLIDLDVAERKYREAQGAEEGAEDKRPPEKQMAEVELALKLRHDTFDKFREALANVCSNSPTRAQLGKLNEPTLIRFINFVGGLLNPEV